MTPDTARRRRVPIAATLGALAFAAVALACAPFDDVLREDALGYIDQAFALRVGDWTAHPNGVGWPMLLAGAMELLGIQSRTDGMLLARLLSVLLVAACAFPVASLARRVAGERAAVLAVIALAGSTTLVWLGGIAYSDALFLLLATCSVAWAAAADGRLPALLGATAVASLSWWARPNGLLVLLALLAHAAIVRRRAGLRLAPLAWLPVVFVAISLPHLVLRAQTFGSPFSYGENSKFFIDSYAQVWDPGVPVPTLAEYLRTHSPAQWFDKFVVHGLLRVGWYFLREIGPVWALLLAGGVWQCARAGRAGGRGLGGDGDRGRDGGRRPDLLLPVLVTCVLLLGLAPVFHVFANPRYMAMTLPFVFVIGAAVLARLAEASPWPRTLTVACGLALAAPVPFAIATDELHVRSDLLAIPTPRVRDEWALWMVRHVPAPVAILEGEDLLQLALEEARASGELPPETAARKGYPTRRPGVAPDLGTALATLERLGIHTLLVDSHNMDRLPYLRDVYAPRWAGRLELVRSFRSTPADRWALADMDVFLIVPARP